MPAKAGIHVFSASTEEDVDGRDKPGHDEKQAEWGGSSNENLGPHHVVERPEGDVGDRRDGTEIRTGRRGRAVRQEQGARLPGDEPERPGADAGGGGRLPAV